MASAPSLHVDPTRQTLLRKQAIREVTARFKTLAREVQALIVTDDAFGLSGDQPAYALNAASKRWAFMQDADKLEAFQGWLKNRVDNGILKPDTDGQPWLSKNVYRAYNAGATMAYRDAKKAISAEEKFLLDREADFTAGFMRKPQSVATLRLLYMRQYTQLRGVTDAQSARLGQILAGGFSDRKSAKAITKDIAKALDVSRYRAETIALTEISNAHANGTLDSYEALGVNGVRIMAEWRCASGACSLCTSLKGVILTIKEARGLLPRHPRCCCSFASVDMSQPAEAGQIRSKANIRKAFVASMKAETREQTARKATQQSRWKGASLKNPQTKRRTSTPRGPLGFPKTAAPVLRVANSE